MSDFLEQIRWSHFAKAAFNKSVHECQFSMKISLLLMKCLHREIGAQMQLISWILFGKRKVCVCVLARKIWVSTIDAPAIIRLLRLCAMCEIPGRALNLAKNEFDRMMMIIATFVCIYCKICDAIQLFLGKHQIDGARMTLLCVLSLAPYDTQTCTVWTQPENTIYLLNFALDAQDCGNYH